MKKLEMPKAQGFAKDMYGHRESIYGHGIMERHHAAWENYCKSIAKCTSCDNTGDVHGFDGSYYGECPACDSSRQRDIAIVNYSITKNGKDFEIEAWYRLLGGLYPAKEVHEEQLCVHCGNPTMHTGTCCYGCAQKDRT